MHILVTGAGGYIGKYLVNYLTERQIKIRAVYRPLSTQITSKPSLPKGVNPVYLDIKTDTDWRDVLKNIDMVVHLADGLRAYESMKTSPGKEQNAACVARSVHLGEAARQAGVKTFLYLSSIKAISGEYADDILKADSQPDPDRSLYGQMKARIEDGFLEMTKRSQNGQDMTFISLRPPLVYGPQVQGNFAKLLQLTKTRWPLPFENFDAQRSMIFITNLCAAIEAVSNKLDHNKSAAYFIHDGLPLSIAEIFKMSRNRLEQPERLFTLPGFLWGFRFASKLPVLKPVIDRLARPLVIDDSDFRKDFHWQPPVNRQEALHKTINSL